MVPPSVAASGGPRPVHGATVLKQRSDSTITQGTRVLHKRTANRMLLGLVAGLSLLAPFGTAARPSDPAVAGAAPVPADLQIHRYAVRFEGIAMAADWSRVAQVLVDAGLIGTRTVITDGQTYCAVFRTEFAMPGCPLALQTLAVRLNGVQPELLGAGTPVQVPVLETAQETYDRRFDTASNDQRAALAAFESRYAPFIVARRAGAAGRAETTLTVRRLSARFSVLGRPAADHVDALLATLPAAETRIATTVAPLPRPGRKPAAASTGSITTVLSAAEGTAQSIVVAAEKPAAGAVLPAPAAEKPVVVDAPLMPPPVLPPPLAGLATRIADGSAPIALAGLLPLPLAWMLFDAAVPDALLVVFIAAFGLLGSAGLLAGIVSFQALLDRSRVVLARWLAPELAGALDARRAHATVPPHDAVQAAAVALAPSEETDLTALLETIRRRRATNWAEPPRPAAGFALPVSAHRIARTAADSPTEAVFAPRQSIDAAEKNNPPSQRRRGFETLVNLHPDGE